ncbi:hypothetical protein C1A40_14760 [Tamlana carrageenivorans]|uniref:Uncharacterized protein n=1 Tax=Pseudotamlana carrageenivorans TaxID=2069432 RepID=A0A2I7SL31_9FLAO|nr:hypothetical protein C1A40_14760 [Tamlana carrageenivorans]
MPTEYHTDKQLLMLITAALIISSLVTINLLLLKFSCNKTIKSTKVNEKPIVLKSEYIVKTLTPRLAPTGS